jgi:hypothetical protein
LGRLVDLLFLENGRENKKKRDVKIEKGEEIYTWKSCHPFDVQVFRQVEPKLHAR